MARPFPSGRQAECGACRRRFSSTSAFDRHRRQFVCLDPAAVGLVLGEQGIWSWPAAEAPHWKAAS